MFGIIQYTDTTVNSITNIITYNVAIAGIHKGNTITSTQAGKTDNVVFNDIVVRIGEFDSSPVTCDYVACNCIIISTTDIDAREVVLSCAVAGVIFEKNIATIR